MSITLPLESQEEAARAIESLTDEDKRRLGGFARSLCRSRRGVISEEGEDLRQEAFLRTLQGKRKQSAKVGMTEHLMGAIRSIAHEKTQNGKKALEAAEDFGFQAMSAELPDPGKEQAQEIVRRVSVLLKGDGAALSVLDSMLAGQRPKEARRLLAIDSKTYNAARQRIRRRAKQVAAACGRICRHDTFSRRRAS